MNLQTVLLEALTTYGLVVLFISVFIASVGVPLPTSFLLIVAGSFVEQGDLEFIPVIVIASIAAILGDHFGYGLGRFGGRDMSVRLSKKLKAENLLTSAENVSQKWGGMSVFFSRWLITAIGPYVNLISGVTRYKLPRFAIWDIFGEFMWVLLYVILGRFFSDRVAEVSEILGDATWVIASFILIVFVAVKLIKSFKQTNR
jgi:membrane protein DedA with SNARE-associated domain